MMQTDARIRDEVRTGEIRLTEPTAIQKRLLDEYRLTQEYYEAYTRRICDEYADGRGVGAALEAIEKYTGRTDVSLERDRKLVCDLLYTHNVLDFHYWEYFSYGMQGKSVAEWIEYLPNALMTESYPMINTSRKALRIIGNKWECFQAFPKEHNREAMLVRSESDREAFLAFCKGKTGFAAKPVAGAKGRGVELVQLPASANPDDVFADLLEQGPVLCEELIVSHESLRRLHPASVNTCRLFTYYDRDQGRSRIVCAWLKAGCNGANVDNAGAGGVVAALDASAGVVTGDASDEFGRTYARHPNTGVIFRGFRVPQWDEAVKLALSLSIRMPKAPLIGWDLALSADRGWQVVEANGKGQLSVMQVATKRGMRRELLESICWEDHRREAAKAKKKTAPAKD